MPPSERVGKQMEPEAMPTRRTFIGTAAHKAAYVTPMVLALTSRHAVAGVSGCGQTGSVCYSDSDCCASYACVDMMGDPVSMGMMGTCE